MENSKNKRRKNCIQIYADEFPADVWETHCLACNVPYDASSITIWLNDADIEYERGGKEAAAGERSTGLTVKATVTFQRWEGDVARFNGEAEFDACDALDSMDPKLSAKTPGRWTASTRGPSYSAKSTTTTDRSRSSWTRTTSPTT